MKLIKKEIENKNASGTITIIPEDVEDLWHIYNIIEIGDAIQSQTNRKVIRQTNTGSIYSNKIKISIMIRIKIIDFD
jgi:protein pelota